MGFPVLERSFFAFDALTYLTSVRLSTAIIDNKKKIILQTCLVREGGIPSRRNKEGFYVRFTLSMKRGFSEIFEAILSTFLGIVLSILLL